MNFRMESDRYIRKLIRMRRRMLRDHTCQRNENEVRYCCDFIETHLNAWTYTERTMAKFFLRNRGEIQILIPGMGSVNHIALLKEFNMLTTQAERITSPIHQSINQ